MIPSPEPTGRQTARIVATCDTCQSIIKIVDSLNHNVTAPVCLQNQRWVVQFRGEMYEVTVAVLGSLSLRVGMDVKQHWTWTVGMDVKQHWTWTVGMDVKQH